MSLPSSDVFTKISSPDEKLKIFQYLAVNRVDLQARLLEKSATLFMLKAFQLEREFLHCTISGMLKPKLDSKGELVLNFLASTEKYFLKTTYTLSVSDLIINLKSDLYHLQRREDYRIKIPKGYGAHAEVASINGAPHLERITFDDLSAGGCRINVKKGLLKQGDVLEALIVLPMKNPIPCTMNVKHLSQNSQFKDFEFAGIQFSKISEINKNKLSATVMDIYREYFLTTTS